MARLMVATRRARRTGAGLRVGGLPVAPEGTAWPRCAGCNGRMQFLAQIPLPELGVAPFAGRQQMLLVFQCQNSPGLCDEWEPDAGGNAAVLVALAGAAPLVPPAPTEADRAEGLDGPTTLGQTQGVIAVDCDDAAGFRPAARRRRGLVVGKLGGQPDWVQGDETPNGWCGRRMALVAQLEHHAGGGINFGDAGRGYAFACRRCKSKAKFLWQC